MICVDGLCRRRLYKDPGRYPGRCDKQKFLLERIHRPCFLWVSEVISQIGPVCGRRADDAQSRIEHPYGYLVGGRFPYETDITERVIAQPLGDPAADRPEITGGNI